MPYSCPLCESENLTHFHYQEIFQQDYYHCACCDLKFVNRDQLLTIDEEAKRYDSHQNDIRSPGYEKFLRRLIDPVGADFPKDAKGLDYGCGPYPMLVEIIKEDGFHNVDCFDPIYKPDKSYLSQNYDFITICEVIEHIYNLKEDITHLIERLNPGGKIYISTTLATDETDFTTWHYIKDETHINIFSVKTWSWIEKHYGIVLEKVEKDLSIFCKRV